MSEPAPLPPPPAQEEPPSPIAKGAKWGAVAGFVVAQLYIANNSPIGFYIGPPDMLVVFAVCIGLGTAIGAGFAWLNTWARDDDERFPG
jgi:hypothetical protein